MNVMDRVRSAWTVLAGTYREWSADGAPRLGAALAYCTSLSVAPLLLIAIGIAGMVFGQEAAQGQILDQLRALTGDDGARATALLFGAEFTQVYARARGARVEPARGAIRIAPRRPATTPQRRGA